MTIFGAGPLNTTGLKTGLYTAGIDTNGT